MLEWYQYSSLCPEIHYPCLLPLLPLRGGVAERRCMHAASRVSKPITRLIRVP
jgi:hypothetical protein